MTSSSSSMQSDNQQLKLQAMEVYRNYQAEARAGARFKYRPASELTDKQQQHIEICFAEMGLADDQNYKAWADEYSSEDKRIYADVEQMEELEYNAFEQALNGATATWILTYPLYTSRETIKAICFDIRDNQIGIVHFNLQELDKIIPDPEIRENWELWQAPYPPAKLQTSIVT